MEKLNIICIDDQRYILASLRKDLEEFSKYCIINSCESAEEAESLIDDLYFDDEPIALVICDHVMPGKNGVDFLIELTDDARFPTLRKILVTGMATHQDTILAINRAHIDCYIEKPWSKSELTTAVRSLLGQFISQSKMDLENYPSLFNDENIESGFPKVI
ncbi:MAG: response regulator [Calditrichaeota bacterium]|nr:MAG: response regulator [Calditrichota bacterium]